MRKMVLKINQKPGTQENSIIIEETSKAEDNFKPSLKIEINNNHGGNQILISSVPRN